MWLTVSVCLIAYLLTSSIDIVSAVEWPQCGEFVFPMDETNLSAEEKQFRRKLPTLFESYDCGNETEIERTLKSLDKYKISLTSDKNCLEKQTLSPSQEITKRIQSDGYPASAHKVTTSDGYILHLHRIANETDYRANENGENRMRTPVFLMHGLLETASSWIALGPKHSLAYLLYDNGYDVWMGNCRGTRPSRGHVRLDPNGSSSKEYWSFSLHELGVYDLPASIDYILEKTNASQLNYVGYSQGTALFFIMTSVRPEYNEKIASMIAMAPAVFVKHSQHTFLNILSKYNALIKKVLDYYMIYSIDYGNRALRWLAEFACKQIGNKSPFPCQFLLFFLDSNQINCTSLPRIVHFIPNSASVLQLFHFAQMKMTGTFSPFRYKNAAINRLKYGVTPPEPYNLTETTVPVTIIYSQSDEVSNSSDVMMLNAKLQNVTEVYQVPMKEFKHIDFIYSRFVRNVINEKVIDVLQMANDQYSDTIAIENSE